jgi:DNA-binding NtrC family response regulator
VAATRRECQSEISVRVIGEGIDADDRIRQRGSPAGDAKSDPDIVSKGRVLVVDPEQGVRLGIQKFLTADGYEVSQAEDGGAAMEILSSLRPDAVVLDASPGEVDIVTLVAQIKNVDPAIACIVLASRDSLDAAALAIQQGAEQFVTKPVQLPTLLLVLERVLQNQRASRRRRSEDTRQARVAIDPFRGESAAIRALAEQARQVCDSAAPVLILGETGSGKGVLASWFHRNGPRAEEPFVDLNCAGLAREFLETELFGHEKGAFTGAIASKLGLFEVAHRGTLFLDEIGDVDPAVQPKLLKVLEDKRFRRLGDVRDRQVDVRLIAATNQDLASLTEAQKFRSDLYFRISTIVLRIPPLRERAEDIPGIAVRLLDEISAGLGRGPIRLSADAMRRLQRHTWPGNIRELRNTLERAALMTRKDELAPEDVGFDFAGVSPPESPTVSTLVEAEEQLIRRALDTEKGRVDRAAAKLGISRSSLYQKIQKYRIAISRV